MDKKFTKYIAGSKKYYGFVEEQETDKGVEMTFLTSEIEQGFPRWFLMFGDYATILEPAELKAKVKALLSKVNNRIDS